MLTVERESSDGASEQARKVVDEREKEEVSERVTETAPPWVAEEEQEVKVHPVTERSESSESVASTTDVVTPAIRVTKTLVSLNLPCPVKERRGEVMLNTTDAKAGMKVTELMVRDPAEAEMTEYVREGRVIVLRRRNVR